jgi:hypothetical protein
MGLQTPDKEQESGTLYKHSEKQMLNAPTSFAVKNWQLCEKS